MGGVLGTRLQPEMAFFCFGICRGFVYLAASWPGCALRGGCGGTRREGCSVVLRGTFCRLQSKDESFRVNLGVRDWRYQHVRQYHRG